MTLLVVTGIVAVTVVSTWSIRLLSDPDRYVAAVSPLCGDRRTSALAAYLVRRRLRVLVGRPAAARLHPFVSRLLTTGAASPVTNAAWRVANRALHRNRRVVRLGRLPRAANGPLMVLTAAAGRVAAVTSRGTARGTSRGTARGARVGGPITSPR